MDIDDITLIITSIANGMGKKFQYVAEGRKHIVCKYIHNNDDNAQTKCKYLLRLRKLDDTYIDSNNDSDDEMKRMLGNISYTDNIIRNWFGIDNYDQITNSNNRVISMTSTFISSLMSSIADDRPCNRKKLNTRIYNYGSIEIDYCNLFKPTHVNTNTETNGTNNDNTITVELKVKCGLKCDSPLLPYDDTNTDGNHDIKLRYSRYDLMQLVKFSKNMKNGGEPWGDNTNNNTYKLSLYNPCDICSRDFTRVYSSIMSLISNPQNNFRFLFDGDHVYGWNKSTDDDLQTFQKHIISIFNDNDNDDDVAIDKNSNFITILSSILCEEEILQKLELLQSLDIIDIEGAYRVFERLECLSIDKENALSMIRDYNYPLDPSILDVAVNIRNNDYSMDSANTNTNTNTNTNEYAHLLLVLASLKIQNNTDIDTRKKLYNQATSIIYNLNTDKCLFLLHIWLLALAAKDASVIVTVKKLNIAIETNGNEKVKVIKRQCYDYAGIVAMSNISYAYTIGIIDIDRKPVEKILTKYNEEEDVCLQATIAEIYVK